MNNFFKLTLIFLLILPYQISAQKTIEGLYSLPSPTGDFSTSINFSKTGIFEYEHSGHLGTEEYGIGTYSLDRKKIILNYNLTKPLKKSYFESKFWINDNEKVELKVDVFDLEGNPIPYANIYILADNNGVTSNKSGNGKLVLNKENRNAELTISFVGYDEVKIPFNQKYNYENIVHLRKWKRGSAPTPILNQIDTLQILQRRKNEIITFNKNNQEQVWTRLE